MAEGAKSTLHVDPVPAVLSSVRAKQAHTGSAVAGAGVALRF